MRKVSSVVHFEIEAVFLKMHLHRIAVCTSVRVACVSRVEWSLHQRFMSTTNWRAESCVFSKGISLLRTLLLQRLHVQIWEIRSPPVSGLARKESELICLYEERTIQLAGIDRVEKCVRFCQAKPQVCKITANPNHVCDECSCHPPNLRYGAYLWMKLCSYATWGKGWADLPPPKTWSCWRLDQCKPPSEIKKRMLV